MNVDSYSECVVSKYFATVMDESLSDFQETKQNIKGPKLVKKSAKPSQPKHRKTLRNIKGQRDIRTAIKGKKNELISFTKEFDKVCKKSGLDVDSEQLQLAITLSKSLQTETADDASSSQVVSTQGRIAKIRKTLQEYGFKVPETKITATNKRIKKPRKHYKLLNTSDEEKHQRITSKYSQILFGCLDCSKANENTFNQDINTPIYNIATNFKYEYMRNNDIFYVNNLVEKSSTSGCLFKDWAGIPGRPVSPRLFDNTTMDFSEILCSQDELDIILSGPLKSAQIVVRNKRAEVKEKSVDIPEIILKNDCEKQDDFDCEVLNVNDDNSYIFKDTRQANSETKVKTPNKNVESVETIDSQSNSTLAVREVYRSCSPDIFDDEVSCVMEVSKTEVLSQGQKTKLFTEDANYMDLTECTHNDKLTQNSIKTSQNVTRRKSNDFMEITDCAVSASQGIRDNVKEIDLAPSLDKASIDIDTKRNESGSLNYIPESPERSIIENKNVGSFINEVDKALVQDEIDLTQNDNDDRPSILDKTKQILEKEHLDDSIQIIKIETQSRLRKEAQPLLCDVNIDLTQSFNEEPETNIRMQLEKTTTDKHECMDLTQSSKSSIDIDDLPDIVIGTQKSQDSDDTIIISPEEYLDNNHKLKNIIQNDEVFDLTQANLTKDSSNQTNMAVNNVSFFEDFVHNHSDSKENLENVGLCDESNNVDNAIKESDDIDLTQSSDGSRESITFKTTNDIPNNSSLGKRDEMSIDYDELCEYVSDKETSEATANESNTKHVSSTSHNVDDNDLVSNSSQNSQIFDLTDKELDYSMHKSRYEDNYNLDFGGISVVDAVAGNRESLVQKVFNDIPEDNSFLPDIYVQKTEENNIETQSSNAENSGRSTDSNIENKIPVVTPKNSEYIIKTNDVTPMLDYETMSTPQRNSELNKYGLKPLKRKRAIQILTHIYNQTHPLLEPHSDEEQPSTSKKPRLIASPIKEITSTKDANISPKKNIVRKTKNKRKLSSPKKQVIIKSPTKTILNNNSHFPININSNSPIKNNSNSPIKNNLNSPIRNGIHTEDVCTYEVTDETAIIKSVDCHPDDWVFQKREKAKVHSCRVPLHIAFHNYVLSRRGLREAILKYEPVNIDDIYKDLVSYGHRYDPKDLLRYLDKKCITVKTADNNARNKR